jgi:hypothetical protein
MGRDITRCQKNYQAKMTFGPKAPIFKSISPKLKKIYSESNIVKLKSRQRKTELQETRASKIILK